MPHSLNRLASSASHELPPELRALLLRRRDAIRRERDFLSQRMAMLAQRMAAQQAAGCSAACAAQRQWLLASEQSETDARGGTPLLMPLPYLVDVGEDNRLDAKQTAGGGTRAPRANAAAAAWSSSSVALVAEAPGAHAPRRASGMVASRLAKLRVGTRGLGSKRPVPPVADTDDRGAAPTVDIVHREI